MGVHANRSGAATIVDLLAGSLRTRKNCIVPHGWRHHSRMLVAAVQFAVLDRAHPHAPITAACVHLRQHEWCCSMAGLASAAMRLNRKKAGGVR